ncbi:MAG: FAD-binding oxidoreductase [Candidatus Eremiobacteraeota bacterium]|nr:FAD-binding oxidoreductase [Candidatus Eremiobacteraeota bacterium]
MNRRTLLRRAAAIAFAPVLSRLFPSPARAAGLPVTRVRPGQPGWPTPDDWRGLSREVGGRLKAVQFPLQACIDAPASAACGQIGKELKNPYYLGDQVGLTQSLGWVGAWTSMPSAYAVAAQSTGDVVAAVNFASRHNLRLVIKGGGHSYHGTSNAPDSLLIWTHGMTDVTLHDGFVPSGCERSAKPLPAVSVGAGALWGRIYDEVTVKGGRYVQGGGCMTVGVAGFIQGGGFGSWSKAYGIGAAGLLEAEVVTADGATRVANACTNPDLFFALKGGGGGTFGAVTRFTLQTHELPDFFGIVSATIKAKSDAAYRRLISEFFAFYGKALFNAHWGEQIAIRPDNQLVIFMAFQGLDQQHAQAVWQPFFDRMRSAHADYVLAAEPYIVAVPARRLWDPEYMQTLPGMVLSDDRPGAPATNIFWASNLDEAGRVWHAYQSMWLPAWLLRDYLKTDQLCESLFNASRHWDVALHFNKGLAGAAPEAIAGAKNTAMNPKVQDAFALLIASAGEPPAYPGIQGHSPDLALAQKNAAAVDAAMHEVRILAPDTGTYLNECDYYEQNWHESFWGANYPQLAAAKDRYDPEGLFFVHHGVGSERFSPDGFTRVS